MISELFFKPSEMMTDILPHWSANGKAVHTITRKETEELLDLAVKWITRRANAHVKAGMQPKEALQKACNESGLSITEAQQKKMLEQREKELAQDPVVIDYVSEREYHDEIEKAARRGELLAAKRVKK